MNNPNEIFTYPLINKSVEAKNAIENHYCRFIEKKCDKQSRTIKYPMGVCSVNHSKSKPIICPHRFLEANTVFKNISQSVFGTLNNILLFPEVKLNDVGTFDFVLVKHRPISNKVEDFCVVEFQSDSTTGTGKLVNALKDFMNGDEITNDTYAFGMNTYNTIKLSYIQMLMKGQVMESWDKNIYWIMQKFIFDNMVNRFNLTDLKYNEKLNTHYHIYDLAKSNNLYKLKLVDKKSTSVANLITAFTKQPTPNIDNFINKLEEKIKLKVGLLVE
tara:strand:+ start:1177 stop:1995 length:819 start_codon:yes stop_codon:yes gene_type:complete